MLEMSEIEYDLSELLEPTYDLSELLEIEYDLTGFDVRDYMVGLDMSKWEDCQLELGDDHSLELGGDYSLDMSKWEDYRLEWEDYQIDTRELGEIALSLEIEIIKL